MSAPCGPSRTGESRSRRRARYVDPNLRVSDAERAEIADCLSRHYGDGRLDQDEFNERLDQAMRAKTQSDLSGLLADLPGMELPPDAGRRRDGQPRQQSRHRTLFLVLVVVITFAFAQALTRSAFGPVTRFYFPWPLIVFVAFLWLRYGPGHHRRF